MKIIISRKGFDVENGGIPSPIMPDGTLLSLPIPSRDADDFSDLEYCNTTYSQLISELKGKWFYGCHVDPDIRRSAHKKLPKDWIPIFGQCDAAESHLENQGVKEGDVFLFFGWFKQTEEKNGKLVFKKGAPDLHVIFGYLQIGKIERGWDVTEYSWHPHSAYPGGNNTMYLASEHLVINGKDTGIPGAGTLKYSDELVLTHPGMTRTKWMLPEFFKDVTISYHTANSFKPEGYFQSAHKGQEFVVSESKEVTKWAKKLIMDNWKA